MKTYFYLGLISIIGLTFVGCTAENENVIHMELEAYFQSFELEAHNYGVEVSLNDIDISGYIEDIEERGTLGQCKSYSNGSKEVVIDNFYWSRADDMEREYLVFHELGHCILGREHHDSRDASGICTSIMQSGSGSCRGIYNEENREKLLEELFE